MWANNFHESAKVHLGEIGAQIGKVESGDKNLDGFTVVEESFESVLTHPNLQGLLMPFDKTNAYAVLCGKINNEIRMRPRERWAVSTRKGREDFSVHPKDECQWYLGDDSVEENYHFDRQAYVSWMLELGLTYDELQKIKHNWKFAKEQHENGLMSGAQFAEFL